ncbi:MAG: hypothetical protein JO208_00030 [Alphaproteobacteria bacterium]|nr:hypothetical protein [Alphaproteobacteria bacterium]
MIHIPTLSKKPTKSVYEKLGFSDLPFPTDPVVNPYSTDQRTNGAIFAQAPVQAEIDKFEKLLIRPNDFSNRAKLAYLWSKGDQESGRGMRKTALLRYFRHRINHDWGTTEFGGQFSAAVVYVSFPAQVDRRYMEQLAQSALVDVCKGPLLQSARAALRLSKLGESQAADVMKTDDGGIDAGRLLDDVVLKSLEISTSDLDKTIADTLVQEGVEPVVAQALAQGRFEEYLRSFRKDGQLEPLYVPKDLKLLDYSRALLFNSIVDYLRTAGFAGGYLFIDDIENLVDQMTRKQRIEFAKEFGLCTVRPGYSNTAHGFFSCVLTTHQQASVGLAQAWADAGLSSIARLDPSSPNSIELPLPDKDHALQIIKAHLDHYRMDKTQLGTIKPFTQDGIDALLQKQNLHPRTCCQMRQRL